MEVKRAWVWVGLMIAALAGISPDGGANALDSPTPPVAWRDALGQKADWYGGPEAIRIAENVVLHQRDSGGWPKNQELAASLTESERTEVLRQKGRADSTIDNGATVEEMTFLAKVYNATKREPYRRAFLKGLDFLFAAQYPNGGWPQFYPNPTGYHRHITFNDGAMIGVMTLLRDIARNEPDYRFVEKSRRQRAGEAVRKGIDCTLKTQVRANGKRTVWCAQHDSVTLEPAPARTYEKASLSGSESVGIVRFLMGIEKPGPEVIEAIEAAIRWFEAAKLTGIRVAQKPDSTSPGGTTGWWWRTPPRRRSGRGSTRSARTARSSAGGTASSSVDFRRSSTSAGSGTPGTSTAPRSCWNATTRPGKSSTDGRVQIGRRFAV
ncbi:MAG: pectate lyase [Armatimonadetes bacterium]|nr:pectate lyase [Armatimonadota bacterium]